MTSCCSVLSFGFRAVMLLPLVVLSASTTAAQTVPVGTEFVVTTTEYHLGPRVAMDDGSRFLVTWLWYFGGMGARGYDESGPVTGASFDPDPGASISPISDRPINVATAGADDFVVMWEALDTSHHLRARRFAGDGSSHTNWFVVTDSGEGCSPDAEHLPWNGFVFAWTEGFPWNDSSIMARFLGDDGLPLGTAFQVNSADTGRQSYPAIASAADGSFVIAWQSEGSAGGDSDGLSIQAQRFAANGSPSGNEFQVNTLTTGHQRRPVIASAPDGRFVIGWSSAVSAGSDASNTSIQVRRFKPNGDPDGPEIQVNEITSDYQKDPAISIGASGDFFVTWTCPSSEPVTTIQGRAMHWSGAPVDAQFTVNATHDPTGSFLPATAGPPNDPHGQFVVVWGNDHSIRGHKFSHSAHVFSDDFETGNVSAWSNAVP